MLHKILSRIVRGKTQFKRDYDKYWRTIMDYRTYTPKDRKKEDHVMLLLEDGSIVARYIPWLDGELRYLHGDQIEILGEEK